MSSIEQIIITNFVKDKHLVSSCQLDQNFAIKLTKAFEKRKDLDQNQLNKIIEQKLNEALLSPVGWVREKAREIKQAQIKNITFKP